VARTVRKKKRKGLGIIAKVLVFIAIAVVFVAYVFPIFWMAVTSFKTKVQIYDTKPMLIFTPTLDNYRVVAGRSAGAESTIGQGGAGAKGAAITFVGSMTRSIIVTVLSTLLATTLGTMAGYVLSRYRIPAKDDLMFFILSTRMLPPIVALIPIFLLFVNIGLKDTLAGFIILYTNFNLAFSVWIMKGFFDDVPFLFEEAAMCDGYTRLRAFFKVVLPMVTTGLAATAMFCGIMIWNEYLFGLVLGPRRWTLMPTAISNLSYDTEGVIWGVLTSSALIYILPVLIFTYLIRKQLLRGVTFGVIRG
jgi:multiple sugar transport system permease protein